jgi:hypothetical protein
MLLFCIESLSLQSSFINETTLPLMESSSPSVKDNIVVLLPYKPGAQHEDSYEELGTKLLFSPLHHLMKRKSEIPADTQMVPTLQAVYTSEEDM